MSFYGNVTYYLSNAFNKVIYRNANSASKMSDGTQINDGTSGPGLVSYEYALSPRSRNDDVILETGNKWIVFGDPQATIGNNQIRIFHQTVANSGTAQITIGATGTKEKNLSFGDLISLPKITFDQAGHITKVENSIVQLEEPPGLGDLDSLKHRMAMLELKVNNEPGDPGSEAISDDEMRNTTALTTLVDGLSVKINDWDMTPGASMDPWYSYKELKGIGSTLHEVMIRLGMRREASYTPPGGITQTGYQAIPEANAPTGSILGDLKTATSQAQAATIISVANRRGMRDLLSVLWSRSVLTDDEYDRFKEIFSTDGL